jgi:hypothetical protein
MILRIPEDLSTWSVSWRLVSNMTPPRDPKCPSENILNPLNHL